MIDILQWLGALLGILGAPLVASAHSRHRRLGFAVWLGSNTALIAWGASTAAWALVGMQVFFSWSSWRGWRNNATLSDTMPWWQIMRRGIFRFYWFPGVTPGIYRCYYDGWILSINCWVFSLEWTDA